jgi:hypothetical protein
VRECNCGRVAHCETFAPDAGLSRAEHFKGLIFGIQVHESLGRGFYTYLLLLTANPERGLN